MTCAVIAIPVAILFDVSLQNANTAEAMNVTASTTPQVVQIEVVYNWDDKAVVERFIRTTFPEEPNTAVAVATEEGGLWKERQSDYHKNGVREPSFCTFQIHEPSWMREAKRLGYEDYKTNPKSCILMARHIYDTTGKNFNQWSAYTSGAYKKHL